MSEEQLSVTDAKELVAQFIEDVWSQGDLNVIEHYVADTYTMHHDPGDPWDQQVLSREGFVERVRLSRLPFPDQRFTIMHSVAEPGQVSVSWIWAGTQMGDVAGIKASGKEIFMSGLTHYFLEGSKITGHWQVSDRLTVFQQLAS